MPSASSTSEGLEAAAVALAAGELVVFPTETVYGVACDPRDEQAVGALFAVKGRPAERAVTVHLAGADDVGAWARELPPGAAALAAAFWPGPLTIVVPARDDAPVGVRAGGATVGLRVPDHPVALELIERFGSGIVGSSANRHGEEPAATVEAARTALGDSVTVYLDGGPCRFAEGSTVVDLAAAVPTVLREGALAVSEIEDLLGRSVVRS